MKRKLLLLLFLIILFGAFVGGRYILLNTQNVNGKIRIVTSPSSNVFINNVAVGKTPFEEKYKVGEYLLKLIPEASQTASWQGKVKIYKNALSYVNRELGSTDIASAGEILTIGKMEKTKDKKLGEIYVETEPSGAIVHLDNDEKGVAPLILADVVRGDHEISVYMPGFLRRTEKINVDSGYRLNAHFKLAIDPNQQLLPKEEKKEATDSAKVTKTIVVISDSVRDTPIGALRVREEASISASESARVNAGDKFELLDEDEGWYKIEYEKGKQGWVYSQYALKQESQ